MTETSAPPPAPDRTGPTPTGPERPTTPFARSSADRVLGGIGGAVAARLDVDPVIVRVVLVVLAIASGGLVVPLYLLTWVVVARDDDPSPRLYPHVAVRDGGALMYVLGAVLAIAIIDGVTDPFTGPGDGFPLLPLALIGIGVALWTRGDRGSRSSTGQWPRTDAPPPPGATSGPASGAVGDGTAVGGTAAGATTTATTAGGGARSDATTPLAGSGGTAPPRPPREGPVTGPPTPPTGTRQPRERSVLGALTIAMALIAAGVAAALDASSSVAVDLGATGVTAIALLVLGLGLLVGSVWGRARWLTLVALLLMPVVGVGVVVREADRVLGIDVDVSSGVGERTLTPAAGDTLPTSLSLLAGSIQIDLTDWTPSEAGRVALDDDGPDLAIEVGAGEVDVDLPTDVAWRVVSSVGLGEYEVRDADGEWITQDVERLVFFTDEDRSGDERERFVLTGGPDDGPVLDIAIDVALGQVSLREPSLEETGRTDQTRPAPPAVVGPTDDPTASTPAEDPSDDGTDVPTTAPTDDGSASERAPTGTTSDPTGGEAATATTAEELS